MNRAAKILHWFPRILCVIAILFISLFALDAFEPGLSLGQQLLAFLIHLIPSFVLFAILLVAWKWEKIGGIIFIVIGLVTSPLVFIHNYRMNDSVWMSLGIISLITLPFLLVGILFLLSYRRKHSEINKIS